MVFFPQPKNEYRIDATLLISATMYYKNLSWQQMTLTVIKISGRGLMMSCKGVLLTAFLTFISFNEMLDKTAR